MDMRLITAPKYLPELTLIKLVDADQEYSDRRARLRSKAGLPDKTQDLLDMVKSDASLALAILQRAMAEPSITLSDVHSNGHFVKFLSTKQRTEEVCVAAVKEDQFVITHLTKAERTDKVRLAAARASGDALFFMDHDERTPPVILAGVKRTGLAVRHLSANELTVDVCEVAAHTYGRAIKFMPDRFREPHVCMAAVQECGLAVKHLKPQQRSPEVCIEAMKQNVNAIKHLDAKDMTIDVCYHIRRLAPKTAAFNKPLTIANAAVAFHEVQSALPMRTKARAARI